MFTFPMLDARAAGPHPQCWEFLAAITECRRLAGGRKAGRPSGRGHGVSFGKTLKASRAWLVIVDVFRESQDGGGERPGCFLCH